MEAWVRKRVSKMALALGYDAEKEAVVAYGMIAIVQVLITLLLVIVFGLLVGAVVEALIICLSVSMLRRYSGGAHAFSADFCTVLTVVYCTLASLLARWAALAYQPVAMMVAIITVYGSGFALLLRYAPVDSPNKPIRSQAKIRRMRRNSLILTAFYLALQLLCYFLSPSAQVFQSYGISLLLGVSWQVFTCTPLGAILLQKLNDLPKCLRKED